MLKRGINLVVITLLITLLYSCADNKSKSKNYLETNYKNYSSIHDLIKDSVNIYIDSLLEEFTPEYIYGWTVDSLVCINREKDKLVAITVEFPNSGKGFL